MVFKLPKREVRISSDIGKEVIKKELTLIPKLPGVYRMLNDKGDILYVGKAKNLPNRLKSYISEKNHIIRTERMLSQTRKLEITTTSNESEALLLEANLIKKHKPKFNILLRDDKSFPFIFIGNKDQWPKIKSNLGKKKRKVGNEKIEIIKYLNFFFINNKLNKVIQYVVKIESPKTPIKETILINLLSNTQICPAKLKGKPPNIKDRRYSEKNSIKEITKPFIKTKC